MELQHNTPPFELIYSGAEANLYKSDFLGKPSLVKHRLTKSYRHQKLDEKLTNQRILQESRNLMRCRRGGLDAPIIYHVDLGRRCIFMEFIDGVTVNQYLNNNPSDCCGLSEAIGTAVARLHNSELVHGDLTTSNLMIRSPIPSSTVHQSTSFNTHGSEESNQIPAVTTFNICIIDLGLSFTSTLLEDKAVDLYLLEKAIKSIHPKQETIIDDILTTYCKVNKTSKLVMQKLNEVRLRGRKRSMVG